MVKIHGLPPTWKLASLLPLLISHSPHFFLNSGHDPLIHCVLITFLSQEIERFNKLLSVIHQSLKDLQLAIKGESILTQELEETYDSFLKARVPMLWQVSSHASCWPLAWEECPCSTMTKLTAPHEEMMCGHCADLLLVQMWYNQLEGSVAVLPKVIYLRGIYHTAVAT